MDDPKTLDLVKDLVLRLLSLSSPSSNPELPHPKLADSLRYAHRLLSSCLCSPSLSPDLSESIKRLLVSRGRSSDALTFSDLHSRLSSLSSRPGAPRSLPALLHLLDSLSDHRPHLPAPLPQPPSPTIPTRKPPSFPTFRKDPDNLHEIALREYLDLVRDDFPVPEAQLVRDVLYAAQGIDGKYIKYSNSSDGYDLPPDSSTFRVPRATRTLIRRLCKIGWLFGAVNGYMMEGTSGDLVGTVGQAFCAASRDELGEYYRLLAVLWSHAAVPIPMAVPGSGVNSGDYLSLRRLAVWFAEPMVRMRLMADLVDRCRSLRGGAMAGAIHERSRHGDPLVQEFLGRLLKRVCSPLFEMVRNWVLEGELEDMFGEFFIVGQPVKAESLWREGYRIETSMLPSFISQTLAQSILRTGKSINFLRVCCEDSGWADAATQAAADVGATSNGLAYGETNNLEAVVAEAAERVDKHLMDVMHRQYQFKDHCLAIKRYLLLGQGDFVQYLMDIVGPLLTEPANTISSFQLAGLLETAIRASNAQYDDRGILDRLKVKMMEHVEGDRGWDVFSLDYDARVPLDTVFTASVMKRYLRIFNFLWKLKKVEHALNGMWKMMKPNRIPTNLFGKDAIALKRQFDSVLRRCQVLWNEMNHFITNFQCYIMFEVLEVSWACFSDEMEAAKDLDDLLAAHEKYLDSIVEKSLLGEKSQDIYKSLFVLFDLILRLRSSADRWFEYIYELQPRMKSKSTSKVKDQWKSKTDVWLEGGRKKMMKLAGDFLGKMDADLDPIAKEYSSSLKGFISHLPVQQHVDLKFLSFRLDFTEYYSQLLRGR